MFNLESPLRDEIRRVKEEIKSIMREYNRTQTFNRKLMEDYLTV